MIAEDLGVITPDVHALRDELGFPGMAILVWAFGGLPTTRTGSRTTASTRSSTHRRTTPTRLPVTSPAAAWALLDVALSSRAALAVMPVQDVLELGSEARMNRPGEVGGNWGWRLEPGQLGPEVARRCAPPRRRRRVRDDVGGARPQSIGSTGSFAATTLRPSRS